MTILAEIHGDPIVFGSGPDFVNRTQSDPGFVNPVRSGPGFVDPTRSGPAFVNVSEANASQFSRAENICCGNKFCCSETKTFF